jgi:uroporphyrinogen decarboxylase
MTPRERMIQTLTFGTPDRIPFEPGWPRESTRKAWATQGLEDGADWHARLLETLGIDLPRPQRAYVDLGVDFRMIPQFEEKTLEHRDGHYVVQDWKGNICEIADTFDVTYLRTARDFVTRRWLRCPVATRDDWERMKLRYRLDAPSRLPADFDARCQAARDRDWMLDVNFSGPFWQMREWCGFEGLCMLMIDDPALVADMAAFWTDFVAELLGRICARVVPDRIYPSEDMAYKVKAMISPAMTREFCKPSWVRWASLARDAGCPIVDVDSDGYVGELIPIWIESGINVCDPIEVAAGNDIVDFRRRFGRQIAFRQGVDKRAIAKGGATIREELKRLEPVVRSGGFIPGCDHGVPPDISWPAYVDYARLLARMTGWL